MLVGLAIAVGRQWPQAVSLVLPSSTLPGGTHPAGVADRWERADQPAAVATPIGREERVANAFAVDEDQFPPPVLFAADSPTRPRVERSDLPPAPVRLLEEIEQVEASEDAPAIALTGTSAGRIAILDGRVVRIDRWFGSDEERYQLIEIADGWVTIRDADGHEFRLVVGRVYRSAARTSN